VIGLCVDSNAQLPDELRVRYGVEVVPLTVVIDGQEFAEGVGLDADEFYARFEAAAAEGRPAPVVTTAAPAPGRFVDAYESLVAKGATEILSVHIGASLSGTLNSARLAAGLVSVPVRLVDTATASFAVSCCLWEAASAIERGASLDEAARRAESTAGRCHNVFVVGSLDLVRAGGRLADSVADAENKASVPVLSLVEGEVRSIGKASTLGEAVEMMVAAVLATGTGLRVGVGIADAGARPLWQELESRLAAAPEVHEVVRYRIGPSVGAHTGPGTAGTCSYPTEHP